MGGKGSGRKRKAPELHIAHGTARAENTPPDRLKADGIMPELPEEFASMEIATAEWNRIGGILADENIIGTTDYDVLKQICIALHYQKTMLPNLDLEDKNMMVQFHKFSATIIKLLPALGLTPESRSRVSTGSVQELDPFEAFVSSG